MPNDTRKPKPGIANPNRPPGIPTPTEARSEADRRWYREGRRNEAAIFRQQRKQFWIAAGYTRNAANDASWDETIDAFPPLPDPDQDPPIRVVEPETPEQALDRILAAASTATMLRLRSAEPDSAADIAWVASAIADPEPQIDRCPSMAAWGLLRWARSEPGKFWSMWEKRQPKPAIEPEPTEAEPPKPAGGTDPGLSDLKRMVGM